MFFFVDLFVLEWFVVFDDVNDFVIGVWLVFVVCDGDGVFVVVGVSVLEFVCMYGMLLLVLDEDEVCGWVWWFCVVFD